MKEKNLIINNIMYHALYKAMLGVAVAQINNKLLFKITY